MHKGVRARYADVCHCGVCGCPCLRHVHAVVECMEPRVDTRQSIRCNLEEARGPGGVRCARSTAARRASFSLAEAP